MITMEEMPIANLSWRSGMLQSWNKLCFTTGYIEMSISMPGTPQAPGLWPAAWTMGNLVRAVLTVLTYIYPENFACRAA